MPVDPSGYPTQVLPAPLASARGAFFICPFPDLLGLAVRRLVYTTGMGRPRTCECGECKVCKGRDYYREYSRRWREQNPERRAAIVQRSTAKNRAKLTIAVRRYRAENPEKAKAHWTATNAIRDGRLTKKPCEVCGDQRVHAHHDDYNKPLDVRWLCPLHHVAIHRED